MTFEGWRFFGVTYGREAKGQEEDKVKPLSLSGDATSTLAGVFNRETTGLLQREHHLYVDNPVYTCDPETEVFKVENYALPENMTAAIENWHSRAPLRPEEITPSRIKVIMGARWTERGILAAFKKLNKSKILDRESTWLWWDKNTFDTADGPGFVLPEGLSAVHVSGDLYFEKDSAVNAYLDLAAYFREATNEEVERLIATGPFEWRSDKPIQNIVSKRCKRLMYMFMSQGGFEDPQISTAGIRDVAREVGMPLEAETRNGHEVLILPESAGSVTKVFEILTHHYSPGIWDGLWRRYNSAQIVAGQNTTQN